MEQNDIQRYALERLRAGVSKADILEQLQAVGWSEEEVLVAYRQALVTNGVPVPPTGAKRPATKRASTVEIVLNFFSFILLGIVASALGVLYFQVINHFFPDTLNAGYYGSMYQATSSAIHYAIAALVIAFPLYVMVVRLWFKKFREEEGKEESKLTKWITYLVLLVASVTIVGDLITTLYTFLSGEISARFFLKALTIIVIAGMVFGFYFLERKKIQYGQEISRKTFQLFGWVMAGFVGLGIVIGFFAAGSPQTERMRTFDAQRAENLSQLAQCVDQYAQTFKRLPATQEELSGKGVYSDCANLRDPETGAPYEYRVVQPLSTNTQTNLLEGTFELCATFSLDTSTDEKATLPTYMYGSAKWLQHTAGRSCGEELVAIEKTATAPVPTAKFE